MSASRRIQKELSDIQNKPEVQKCFREIQVDDKNILVWQGLIVPENPPYNKGAFKVQIDFPVEYPFKPPKITIKTKIYHPNVDEKGQICMPIITPENWKPATKIEQVIQNLVAMIHDPDADHFLRADVAEEFTKNKQIFMKNAEEYTKKYAEKRPNN